MNLLVLVGSRYEFPKGTDIEVRATGGRKSLSRRAARSAASDGSATVRLLRSLDVSPPCHTGNQR